MALACRSCRPPGAGKIRGKVEQHNLFQSSRASATRRRSQSTSCHVVARPSAGPKRLQLISTTWAGNVPRMDQESRQQPKVPPKLSATSPGVCHAVPSRARPRPAVLVFLFFLGRRQIRSTSMPLLTTHNDHGYLAPVEWGTRGGEATLDQRPECCPQPQRYRNLGSCYNVTASNLVCIHSNSVDTSCRSATLLC